MSADTTSGDRAEGLRKTLGVHRIKEQDIIELLADARHACAVRGIDYTEADKKARAYYDRERGYVPTV